MNKHSSVPQAGGPRVDVLIPVFNAARTIRQAVRSIQEQTLRDIAIFVIDDGSTDATASILNEMAQADPRLHVISRANGGIVDALNAGLQEGSAPLIARHDADDIAHPDRLAIQVQYLETHPGCVAVSGAARHIDEHDRLLGTISRLKDPDRADPAWAPAREPYLLHPFLMVRREAMMQAGGYRHVCHAEDSDLYWRLQEHGHLFNMTEILGDYRMHAASISSASLQNGRMMALSSQLSGLSALRRRAGRPDLDFQPSKIARYRDASSLDALLALEAGQLDPRELEHLRVAVAAKLLELASYRPYELEAADCRFIAGASQSFAGRLSPSNRTALKEARVMSAVRLIQKRRPREAMLLLSPSLYPVTLLRLLFRIGLPESLRRNIKRLTRRAGATG